MIKRPQPPPHRQRKLQHQYSRPGFENPVNLLQTDLLVDKVAQAEAEGDRFEALVGKGDGLRISLDTENIAPSGGSLDFPESGFHHPPVEVIDDHPALLARSGRSQEGEIARPATEVQYPVPFSESQKADSFFPPALAQARPQDGLGPVVGRGDGVELLADESFLFPW